MKKQVGLLFAVVLGLCLVTVSAFATVPEPSNQGQRPADRFTFGYYEGGGVMYVGPTLVGSNGHANTEIIVVVDKVTGNPIQPNILNAVSGPRVPAGEQNFIPLWNVHIAVAIPGAFDGIFGVLGKSGDDLTDAEVILEAAKNGTLASLGLESLTKTDVVVECGLVVFGLPLK